MAADVTEVDGDGSQTVAGRLLVEGGFEYSDLDELIVNHVKAMARRVDELMAHEKFKAGTTEDIERHLRDYVNAYPTRSIYAFALNRQKPGHFNIVFLANKNSNTVSWPVKVAPSYYALFDTSVPSVPQLTDAFKMRCVPHCLLCLLILMHPQTSPRGDKVCSWRQDTIRCRCYDTRRESHTWREPHTRSHDTRPKLDPPSGTHAQPIRCRTRANANTARSWRVRQWVCQRQQRLRFSLKD